MGVPAGFAEDFDWRTFQQEYRDDIDLAKLAQIPPVIGVPVGFIVKVPLDHETAATRPKPTGRTG